MKKVLIIFALFFCILLLGDSTESAHTIDLDFEQVFENHSSVIMLIDSDTGRISYANKSAAKFYGYPMEKLEGMFIQDISAGSQKDIMVQLEEATNKIKNYFEVNHKTAAGDIRNVEMNSYPYIHDNNTYLVTIINDVTELKQLMAKNESADNYFIAGLLTVIVFLGIITALLLVNFKRMRVQQKEREKRVHRNSILVNVMSHEFGSSEEQLDYVLNETLKLTESKFGYIYLYDEDKKEFILNSWSTGVMDECKVMEKQTTYLLDKTGFWGEVIRQRKPIVNNDFKAPNVMKKGYPEGHVEIKKFMSVPIIMERKIVAVLGLANKTANYDNNDIYQISALMNGVWNAKVRRERSLELEAANKALKKKQEDITYLSYHDSLTGLYNRRFFEEELSRLNTKRNLPLSIIMGDVNGLKLTNDIFGHSAGDELLIKAANTIKEAGRSDDITARWGGDEFIIILPMTSEDEAKEIAERIRERFSAKIVKAFNCSISMGYGTKSKEDESLVEAIEEAETRMYTQKTIDRKKYFNIVIKSINDKLHENTREKEHALRVSELCFKTGAAMGFAEDELNRLKYAGKFHDIGKIVNDADLLNSSDGLTDEEWQDIRQHPLVGYRIMNCSDDTVVLAKCILSHHERWDGKGYPKGLSGTDIPLCARIIAIAESYDAMTNESSYKARISRDEAADEIHRNAGTQFDPEIADVFVNKVLKDTDAKGIA